MLQILNILNSKLNKKEFNNFAIPRKTRIVFKYSCSKKSIAVKSFINRSTRCKNIVNT